MTSNLNWVDYIILAVFLFSILSGLWRGLVREIISLVTLIAAFIVAIIFSSPLANAFTNTAAVQNAVNQASTSIGVNAAQPISYAALGISFGILFAATMLAGAIIGFIINIPFQAGILGMGNRLLGAVFGFFKGFLINIVLIFVVQLTPLGNQTWWHQSQFVTMFQPEVQILGNFVSPSLANLKAKFGQGFQNLNSSVQTGMQGAVQGVSDVYTGFTK